MIWREFIQNESQDPALFAEFQDLLGGAVDVTYLTVDRGNVTGKAWQKPLIATPCFKRLCTGFPGREWKQGFSFFPNFHEI